MTNFVQIQKPIKVVTKRANIDYLWGAYNSLQDALSALGSSGEDVVIAGRRFGVTNPDGTVDEYRFTKTGDATKYEKIVNGSSSGGSGVGSVAMSFANEEVDEDYINMEVGITLKDADGGSIGSSYKQLKIEKATTTTAGLMSASDKTKLDGLSSGSSSSGSEPTEYLKSASVNGNTLTLTKKDGTTQTYTPDTYTKSQIDTAHTQLGTSIETAQATANGKQATLVSGTNIKTINNQSILGSGNITIDGGSLTEEQEAKLDSAISKVNTFNTTLETIGSSSTDAVISAQASKISALETKTTKIEDIQTSGTSSKILVGDSQADPTIKVESKKTYVYGKLYLNDAELTNTQSSGSSSERTFYPIIGTPSLYKSASISKTDISSSKVADLIYPIYDTLCTNYPRIIKRLADFGTGYNNQPIRHYQIKCTNPVVNTTEGSLEGNVWDDALYGNKKIFINAGTHGDEKSSTYGMALAVKDIVESKDDWARFLKGNFTIDIIPCLYPYGYDANTRTYPNGTNINRDYDNQTTPEATIVRNYINTNKSNLACALDSHNTVLKLSFMEVVPTYSKFNQYSRIANNLAMSLLPELETIYNDTSLYPYIYMVKSSHYGTFAAMVNDLGVTGHTVEAPRDVNDGGNTNYTNSCELTKNFMINLMIAYGYDYLNNL